MDQQEGGAIVDQTAGDVSYSATAWMGWAAYSWGSDNTPRLDGVTWPGHDFVFDGIHPSPCLFYGIDCGRKHTADLMMGFYTTSPYTTPWFTTVLQPYSLTVKPKILAFKKWSFGTTGETSTPLTITVTNKAGAKRTPLRVGSVSIASDANGTYEVVGGTCSTGVLLQPGDAGCTVMVNFTPSATSSSKGTLTIGNNGSKPELTAKLSGSGKMPKITHSPSKLAFGTVTTNTSSGTQAVTLTNDNPVPVPLDKSTIGGKRGTDYQEVTTCNGAVPANSSCTISITFTPGGKGSRHGKLYVSAGAGAQTITVPLSGSGT